MGAVPAPRVTLSLVDGLADSIPHSILATGLLQRVPAYRDSLLADLLTIKMIILRASRYLHELLEVCFAK